MGLASMLAVTGKVKCSNGIDLQERFAIGETPHIDPRSSSSKEEIARITIFQESRENSPVNASQAFLLRLSNPSSRNRSICREHRSCVSIS